MPSPELHDERVQARAALARVFALAGIVGALIAGWSLIEAAPARVVGVWLILVVAGEWLVCVTSLGMAGRSLRRPGPFTQVVAVAEAIGLAALWAALPVWAFGELSASGALAVAGAMAAMIVAGLGLAAFPAAGIAWIGTIAAAFLGACYRAGFAFDARLALAIAAAVVTAMFAILRFSRWSFGRIGAAAQLQSQAELVSMLLHEYEHRGAGWLWQVDGEGRLLYTSSRMRALLGRSTPQLVGQHLSAVLGGDGCLEQALDARQAFAGLEMQTRGREGARWISLSGDPILAADGSFQGFRGVGADITEGKATQQRLIDLANVDALSGLPNRGHLRELLGEKLGGSSGAPCAFMFLDLDDFKPVNDTFGHPHGDRVLKQVAERLVREAGETGIVGRMGGDEFAVVIHDALQRSEVQAFAERLVAAVAEPYDINGAKVRLGLSIGCAFGPGDGDGVDDLIQKADLALYQAKARGGGRCCTFNREMQRVVEDRMRLERDLRQALTAGQFRLMYQPLIKAATETLVGFEALIRWQHPTRGVVSPLDFIPLAEENGVIMKLGDWVIDEACRAVAHWPDDISVAVNVSPKQLVLPALPNAVSQALTRHRLHANRLELEVTESVFLGDTAGALDVLRRLRTIGVRIALDDFGTGYSSLGYLNKTVFHKLKIDGSFVREAGDSGETVAIIQAIVQLARSFRMTVTAEGVETIEDFNRMRDLGCHLIQGYYFGRPMDFETADRFVREANARKRSA